MPFEIAGLMTDASVTYSRTVAPLTHPEQGSIDYLFDDMDQPTSFTLRNGSGYAGLASAQRFSGHAVKSFYAEMEPPARSDAARPKHPLIGLSRFRLGHAERVEIGGQHRLFLAPLVLVLLAQADHCPERLDVEAVAFGLGIDLAQIGGERRLLLLEPLDAGDDGAKLIFG